MMPNDNNVIDFDPSKKSTEQVEEPLSPKEQQSLETLEFFCEHPDCKSHKRKIFRIVPKPSLANILDVSMIIYPHEKPFTCRYCNTYYQIAITGIEIKAVQFVAQPIPPPSGVVLAPSGLVT